jgi:hypothetical protein
MNGRRERRERAHQAAGDVHRLGSQISGTPDFGMFDSVRVGEEQQRIT